MKGEGLLGKHIVKYEEYFYVIVRALVGLFFFLHGAGKAFGLMGKPPMTGQMLIFGWFEVTAGLLILIGLWTRIGALLGSVLMIAAYVKAHAPGGLNPVANGGELALMFLFTFFIILVHGSGRWGLEHWMHKKEKF